LRLFFEGQSRTGQGAGFIVSVTIRDPLVEG
jgi:hypothetical protein